MTETKTSYRGRIKYDEGQALKYQTRKPSKHKAEMRLLDRAFAGIPKKHRILDAPCGGGRVTIHLSQRGYQMSAADLSESMIQLARKHVAEAGLSCTVESQDVERFTYPDQHFDSLVCFRLFHHFPSPEIRRKVVIELCRVARQYVVLSYFSPYSATAAKRKLKAKLLGKPTEHYGTPLSEVAGYFAQAGFDLVKDYARFPLVHTLHVAVFERSRSSKS